MPALAYTLDMNHRTDGNYGVNESILSSAIAALVFPILGVQPLTSKSHPCCAYAASDVSYLVVGITGLINLFNYTTFDIIAGHANYLQFQAWVLM